LHPADDARGSSYWVCLVRNSMTFVYISTRLSTL
jgi:hypothetical protein